MTSDIKIWSSDRKEFNNYFIGVDPAMGGDFSVVSKIHSDGRIEIIKTNKE